MFVARPSAGGLCALLVRRLFSSFAEAFTSDYDYVVQARWGGEAKTNKMIAAFYLKCGPYDGQSYFGLLHNAVHLLGPAALSISAIYPSAFNFCLHASTSSPPSPGVGGVSPHLGRALVYSIFITFLESLYILPPK